MPDAPLGPTDDAAPENSSSDDRAATVDGPSTEASSDSSAEPRESSWRMYFWPLMAILVIAAFYFRDQWGGADGANSPAVGKSINRVLLAGLTDENAQLQTDDFKGRVSLINFWGYWCPPCVAEMPELIKLRDEFKSDARFQLVSVACPRSPSQPEELRQKTLAFLKSREYDDLAVFSDPTGTTRSAVAQLNEQRSIVYPTTLRVGPDGVVRAMWAGYSPAVIRDQRAQIPKLLNQ